MWVECEDGSLCNLDLQEAIIIGNTDKVIGGHAVVGIGPSGRTVIGTGSEVRCREIVLALRKRTDAREWPHGKPSNLSVAKVVPEGDGRKT